jgi:hypothetical protein
MCNSSEFHIIVDCPQQLKGGVRNLALQSERFNSEFAIRKKKITKKVLLAC